jgi:electron transfer flavoprotein beta subunit
VGELRVLACVKRVPAPGARITLTADQMGIDTKNLGFTTSPHEECAVEEAILLVEKHGGAATVLTLGAVEADEQLRYAISVGVVQAVHITHPALANGGDLDPQATAAALVSAIQTLEAADGPFDLMLFGNESADSGGFQVGVRVARALGRPIVNGVKAVSIDGDVVTAKRESASGFEVYELPLPAALGVKEGLNLPRYPTLPGRLKSKKVDIPVVASSAAGGGLSTLLFENAAEQVTNTTMLGSGPEAAPAIVDLLEELGLL